MASASLWQQYFPRDTFSPYLGSTGSKCDISLKKKTEREGSHCLGGNVECAYYEYTERKLLRSVVLSSPLFGISELSVSLPRSRALPERRNFPRTLALVLFVCLHSYSGSISLCHYLTTRF